MIDVTRAYGLSLYFPTHDQAVGHCLDQHGEFARPELEFLLVQAARQRGTFLDIGANIGAISVPFAKTRPDWNVVAVEAHSGLAAILAANAISNGCRNLTTLHAAAGPSRQIALFPEMDIGSGENLGMSRFGDPSRTSRPVLMLPLDELAPADTRLVKIDVEGFEPEVIAGARQLIERTRPLWIVEAVQKDIRRAVMSVFRDAGYGLRWFYSPWVTHRPLKGRTADDPNKGDASIVAVPPGVELIWSLPPAGDDDEHWPIDASAYPYLEAYGY